MKMSKEQQDVWERFDRTYGREKEKKIIIYGTGINAEAVVKNAITYHIIGLMDGTKTGSIIWELPVFSYEDLVYNKPDFIVVVARPAVLSIIYARIASYVEEIGIPVYDVDGNDLKELCRKREREHSYFSVSKEMLIKEIEKFEAVSFDIFDTLLMRKVLFPADVFALMEIEVRKQYDFDFGAERVRAEKELLEEGKNPTIFEIYERLGENLLLDEAKQKELIEMEQKYEEKVLIVRKEMKDIFNLCLKMKKQIYLVSDMYLTEEMLGSFLKKRGISGYQKLIVSCEYGCSKKDGLFAVLEKELGGKTCLHIGDSMQADIESANAQGLAAFYIMSGREMLENSLHDELLADMDTLEKRLFLGLYVAKAFQNPFSLCGSKGKVFIKEHQTGYLFVAPLLVGFTYWMAEQIKKVNIKQILFGARDGYLIEQLYEMYHHYTRQEIIAHNYIRISRRNVSMCTIETEEDIWDMAKGYQGNIQNMWQDVFGVAQEDIEAIKLRVQKEKEAYLQYLMSYIREERIAFFDFMSRGTCQTKLQRLLKKKLCGLYFQKSESMDAERNQLEFSAFCDAQNAFSKDYAIFKYCDFLEAIVTDFSPSFYGYDEEGTALFYPEKRSNKHMAWVREMHEEILEFARDFFTLYPYPVSIEYPFYDKIFGMIDIKYSRLEEDYSDLLMYDGYSDKQVNVGELFRQTEK